MPVRLRLLLVFAAALFLAPAEPRLGETFLEGPGRPVPADYFGQHIHRLGEPTPWPPVAFGAWRLWDAYVAWPWLEPERGRWDFGRLDRFLALAESHAVEVLLPLGLSPTWASARPAEPSAYKPGYAAQPANLADWQAYVSTVAGRYRGRIRLYEIWNEPNLRQFWSGDLDTMVTLCRAARRVLAEVDPEIRIVSPSATGRHGIMWLDRFLAAGGADCFDVVGFHLYVGKEAPELLVPLAGAVRAVMYRHGIADRPLWNTESGWLIVSRTSTVNGDASFGDPLSEERAAAWVARALILAWAAGVERFYWYAWDNGRMGLAEADGTLKAPATAYATVGAWLLGARLTHCAAGHDGTWTCRLEGQRPGWIVWNTMGRRRYVIPAEWDATTAEDLGGRTTGVEGILEIGEAPILVR